jgi:predicted HAD superfamily Cof-like phosphohydrolase
MQRQLEQVEDVHRVFDGHIEARPTVKLAPEVMTLRARLLEEELESSQT